MSMNTLTNSQFMEILRECCNDGKIDDTKLNQILKCYHPYNLSFGKGG